MILVTGATGNIGRNVVSALVREGQEVRALTWRLEVPLVVMTYYNPVQHMGHERFAAALVSGGVSAAILPDLPLDELDGWGDAATAHGVEVVLLAAPTTTDERLAAIKRELGASAAVDEEQ